MLMDGMLNVTEKIQDDSKLLLEQLRVNLSFIKMAKIVGKAHLGRKIRSSLLGMFSFRYLLDIQGEVFGV